jgi:hypothetical protein
MPKKHQATLDDIHSELVEIRKMMILLLLSRGLSEQLIDKAVEMGSANIRGLFPKKEIKKSIQKWNEGGRK